MDERLREAAEYGNIDALYAIIQDDANIFRRIEALEFVDTPLHVAAAAGHTDLAMEMMNLKPSFAKKLNQRGLTAIHLALQNEQTDLVMDLLSIDTDLVRVKAREGHTPLHHAAREGNVPLLSHFLNHGPKSILDLTIRKQTALHIAVQHNRFEAFEDMLQWIQKTPADNQFQRGKIINLQDKDGNTVLHLSASNNQHKMTELLINCKEVDRNSINKRQGLHSCSNESLKLPNRAPLWFCKVVMAEIGGVLHDYIKDLTPETINALLVVLTLILTMTYQAILSPLGAAAVDAREISEQIWFHYVPCSKWSGFLFGLDFDFSLVQSCC